VSKHSKKSMNKANRIPRLTLLTVLVAATLLALAAVTVVSRQHARVKGPVAAERNLQMANKSKFKTVKVAGQDVQVDGQTGQIKPLTQEEAQKLAAGLKDMVNQSTEGLEQVQHADGSVSVDLKGRFQNVSVARVNQDGSVTQSCVDSPESAAAFFGIDPKLIDAQTSAKPITNRPAPQTVEKD
jgi:hypothetical protein